MSKRQRISNRKLAHKLWIKRWWQLEYTLQVLWYPESKNISFLWRANSQNLAYITFKSELKVYPRRNAFFIHTKNHQQRLPVVIKIVQIIILYIHRFIFKSAQLQTKLCLLNINQNLNPNFFKRWVRILSIFLCVTIVVYCGYDSWQTTERTHFFPSFWVTNKVPRYAVTIFVVCQYCIASNVFESLLYKLKICCFSTIWTSNNTHLRESCHRKQNYKAFMVMENFHNLYCMDEPQTIL